MERAIRICLPAAVMFATQEIEVGGSSNATMAAIRAAAARVRAFDTGFTKR